MLRADLREGPKAAPGLDTDSQGFPQQDYGQAGTSAAPGEWDAILREVAQVLSERKDHIEEFITAHRLASTVAAFALGVAVGRWLGRS